jgi:hypothetical protein
MSVAVIRAKPAPPSKLAAFPAKDPKKAKRHEKDQNGRPVTRKVSLTYPKLLRLSYPAAHIRDITLGKRRYEQ